MARAKIVRALAVDALGGQDARPMLESALKVLWAVRKGLWGYGLQAALQRKRQRQYTYTALKRGGRLYIDFDATAPLVRLVSRGASVAKANTWAGAVDVLLRRCNDLENTTRVLLAIERARQQCYRLAEEGTRWL